MKTMSVLFILVLLALVGGFAYFAMIDVPVEQSTITETIPHDRLGI